MTTPADRLSVLSIQSHVVHGMVGNKAATFPLQLHGVDVDPLNVVRFSNHTGYKVFKGSRMPVEEFNSVIEGLRANNILGSYTAILSGYVGNDAVLEAIHKTVIEAKGIAPTKYLCDPVIGDNGKMYVPEEVVEVYRQMMTDADMVTPNGFEASVVSQVEITSIETAIECADWFHAQGVQIAVIKSFELDDAPGVIHLLGSKKIATDGDDDDESAPKFERYLIRVPKQDYYFTGTGDCFSAIFLAQWMTKFEECGFKSVLETSVAAIQNVLKMTDELRVDVTGKKELSIVASAQLILNPTFECQTERLA